MQPVDYAELRTLAYPARTRKRGQKVWPHAPWTANENDDVAKFEALLAGMTPEQLARVEHLIERVANPEGFEDDEPETA